MSDEIRIAKFDDQKCLLLTDEDVERLGWEMGDDVEVVEVDGKIELRKVGESVLRLLSDYPL